MKTSLELEEQRKELLNPAYPVLESIMNFERGQVVGKNPTNHGYQVLTYAIRGLKMRGNVVSVNQETQKIKVRWPDGKLELFTADKLKIYS